MYSPVSKQILPLILVSVLDGVSIFRFGPSYIRIYEQGYRKRSSSLEMSSLWEIQQGQIYNETSHRNTFSGRKHLSILWSSIKNKKKFENAHCQLPRPKKYSSELSSVKNITFSVFQILMFWLLSQWVQFLMNLEIECGNVKFVTELTKTKPTLANM